MTLRRRAHIRNLPIRVDAKAVFAARRVAASVVSSVDELAPDDAVLREFVRRMAGSMRPYDAIGRYGGEEFLVVLPGCDDSATRKQAERMRAAMADESMAFNEESRTVTCSFGATSAMPQVEVTAESLIRLADDALYGAKRQGRNRVVFIPSSEIQHLPPVKEPGMPATRSEKLVH